MDLSTSNDLTTSSLLVAVSAQEVETITEEVTTHVEDDETLDLDDEEETKQVENNGSDEDEDEEIVDVENTNDEEVEEATEDEEESEIEETADTVEEDEEEAVLVDEEDTAETSAEEETTEETTDTEAEAADTQEESSSDDNTVMEEEEQEVTDAPEPPQQTGPLVDIFGETLLSLVMIDDKNAQLEVHNTNDALKGKKVIGVYFSADWCGPCRQFTPELVNFYNKMNARRGKQNQFEIVWVSRCRDMNSFGQYFTHMNWYAMQPELAMGQFGQKLSDKFKVKSIPTLVLLDEEGNVITLDGRNKIPQDMAGIGFPWANPLMTLYRTIVPKTFRSLIINHIKQTKTKILLTLKGALGMKVTA